MMTSVLDVVCLKCCETEVERCDMWLASRTWSSGAQSEQGIGCEWMMWPPPSSNLLSPPSTSVSLDDHSYLHRG